MRVLAWQRLPVAVRAVLVGLLVLIAGNLPWSILVSANLQSTPSFPWAVLAMGVYLWLFWEYLRGRGWPRTTTETRRTKLRISPLSARLWQWSLLAGGSTFATLIVLLLFLERMVNISQDQFAALRSYPFFSVAAVILMGAVVAGVVEEAAFRGYMQVPIEKRYGLAVASIIVAIMFSLAHLSHGLSYALPLVPFYLAGSAIYSLLAYRTGSILPGVVLHISTDVLLGALAFREAISTAGPPTRPMGMYFGPWGSCAAVVVFATLGTWSFRRLAKITQPNARTSAQSVVAGIE